MSAIAAITLADGLATPVNHTFAPVSIDPMGVAQWADRSGGIALGYPVITFKVKQPTKLALNYRVTAKVVTPVLEVTSPSTASGIQPAPTKAYDLIGNIEFILPERSTLAQRQVFFSYVRNFLANAPVTTAAVENFEAVY